VKKRWIVLSIALVVGILWYVTPVFGGWSWCGDDPVFLITGKDGEQVQVSVDILVGFAGDLEDFDLQQVKVVLSAPKGTEVEVLDDGGFKAKVKDDGKEGEVKLKVAVKKQGRDEYRLEQVTVQCDGTLIEPKTQKDHKWVFKFELP